MKKARPKAVNIAIFTPYPGSDIWENPKKYNVEILFKPQNYIEINLFYRFISRISYLNRPAFAVIHLDGRPILRILGAGIRLCLVTFSIQVGQIFVI